MKVQIWSDFVCPFCYLGKRRFEEGLAQFEHKDEIEVEFKSFELDPDIQVEGNLPVHERLASKYGMSIEQARENTRNITEQAKEIGLEFNMETAISTNTFDAHRLAHFAASEGKVDEMVERLFKAHFTDSLNIGKHDVLADLAVEVGLDRDEVMAMLSSDTHAGVVRSDESQATQVGVRGVPHFVIDDKYVVRGAHPGETFLGALKQAWDERD